MSAPAAALDNLVDFWPMDEGAGPSCSGCYAGIAMPLRRCNFCADGSLWSGGLPPATDAAAGWFADASWAGRAMYNGQGRVGLVRPLAAAGLLADGAGFTLLCRVKPRYVKSGCSPAAGTLSDVLGAAGMSSDRLRRNGCLWGSLRFSGQDAALTAVGQWNAGGTAVTSTGGEWGASANGIAAAFVAALRVKRAGSALVMQGFVNGAAATGAASGAPGSLEAIDTLAFGDDGSGVGAVAQACLVKSPLSDADLAAVGSSLDALESAARAMTPAPWLHHDGTAWLTPEPFAGGGGGVLRVNGGPDGQGAIASAGAGGRQTRRVHEFGGGGGPRRCTLAFNTADGEQVDRVRQGFRLTRGGARSMRWRHPVDDAAGASAQSAPRVRIVSPQLVVDRIRAGSMAAVGGVEIEYLD